jgi:hypothetical protein
MLIQAFLSEKNITRKSGTANLRGIDGFRRQVVALERMISMLAQKLDPPPVKAVCVGVACIRLVGSAV